MSRAGDAPDRTLRYAIVGSGMMGREHIHALAAIPDCEVVAICDPDPESLEQGCRAVARSWDSNRGQHGGKSEIARFGKVHELVAAGGFDVAVVATPNYTHRSVVEPLLNAGVHLLIEKPLCTTVQDCKDLISLERRTAVSHKVVWVGLEYRYMAPTMRLLEHVSSGVLGRLHMLAIREHRFPFLPKVGDWNRFSNNTGGTLVEKCCHFFDLMRLVLRSEPSRVFASGAQDVNHLDETYDGRVPDILDNALVIVDLENGARASLDLCMFAEATKNEQEISVVGSLGKAEALVTEGLVRLGLRANGWFQCDEDHVGHGAVPSSVLEHGAHHGSSWRQHLAMQHAIRSGTTATVSTQDGLMSVAMGEAAHRSISLGRAVRMSEVLSS